jgi:hypothetical protein
VKPEPLQFIDEDSYLFALLEEDSYPVTFDEAPPPKPKKKRKPSKEKMLRAAQKKQAKEFLSKILADGDASAAAIHEAASKAGLPKEALHRAKGSLGIRAVATENGSVWRLPKIENGGKE